MNSSLPFFHFMCVHMFRKGLAQTVKWIVCMCIGESVYLVLELGDLSLTGCVVLDVV